MSTFSGTEMKPTKFIGPVPTIMRVFTHKEGDLPSYFDEVDETQRLVGGTSKKQKIINNPSDAGNKGKLKEQLTLEQFCGFC